MRCAICSEFAANSLSGCNRWRIHRDSVPYQLGYFVVRNRERTNLLENVSMPIAGIRNKTQGLPERLAADACIDCDLTTKPVRPDEQALRECPPDPVSAKSSPNIKTPHAQCLRLYGIDRDPTNPGELPGQRCRHQRLAFSVEPHRARDPFIRQPLDMPVALRTSRGSEHIKAGRQIRDDLFESHAIPRCVTTRSGGERSRRRVHARVRARRKEIK